MSFAKRNSQAVRRTAEVTNPLGGTSSLAIGLTSRLNAHLHRRMLIGVSDR